MTNDPRKEQQGEGNRPESDGPDQPPALPPKKPGEPESPEKSHDIHGAPETPV